MGSVAAAVAIMTGLGLGFAVVLAVAYRYLKVEEDPRLETVTDMLPGNNCGACGEPGCAAFAKVLVAGAKAPSACTVAGAADHAAIADFLGVDVGAADKRVARLRCAGGEGSVLKLAEYKGLGSCRAAVVAGGGGRGCAWGCLGLADCERACTFDAIRMSARGLPVVDVDLCTACGDCVTACPLDLFVIVSVGQKLFVQCASPLAGEDARRRCAVACDACGRCAADAPPGVIEMKDGLPRIRWEAFETPGPEPTWRCPTGAIVWIEGQQLADEDPAPGPARRLHAS